MKVDTRILQHLIRTSLICGAFLTGGCATGVAALEKIANVEMTINQARENNAITYAPLELKFAEDKLIKAKKAIEDEEFEQAKIIAEKALADAQYAEAKSRAEKAKILEQEISASINALRGEANRPK